jgi:hypothetical protein
MIRSTLNILGLFLLIGFIAVGCKKDPPPLSERIAKNWSANTVKHGNVVVFEKAGTSNTADYSGFRISLAAGFTVTFVEVNGDTFNGQWELIGNNTLRLKNLSSTSNQKPPTGSNGTIDFTINSINDTTLDVTRVTDNPKTGNTRNQYVLSNP